MTEFPYSFDGFSEEGYGFQGTTPYSSLVLDSDRGEIVRALVKPGQQRGVRSEERALAALRNHSEAERRRRERINSHLATLRGLVPGTNKMDKASLLAEVVKRLKELRKSASEAAKGLTIPTDTDEVRVEQQDDGSDEHSYSVKAFLCCEYKHELIRDVNQAMGALRLKTFRAEMATLGSRMTNLFVLTGCKEGGAGDTEKGQLLAGSVREALRSVLDKFYASQEFCESSTLPNKRRRVSLFGSSSTSSFGDAR